MTRHPFTAALALAALVAPAAAYAQASDPGAQTVDRFDTALLGAMKAGRAAGPQGRFTRILPVDKLVKSQLIGKSGTPTAFTWRMRQTGGQWKIVDVFYNGAISQLASQRSDFQSTLASGGAAALVKKLNDKTETLLKG